MNNIAKKIAEENNFEYIGEIKLGEECYVSDPCYDTKTYGTYLLKNMKKGTYYCFLSLLNAEQISWGERIAALYIMHKDCSTLPTEIIEGVGIGVDSGQAGFYDKEYFVETRNNDEWYDEVCVTTFEVKPNPKYRPFEKIVMDEFGKTIKELEGEEFANAIDMAQKENRANPQFLEKATGGVIGNKCCVSSSGFGDGEYTLSVGKNKDGQIVSAVINYIDRNDIKENIDKE